MSKRTYRDLPEHLEALREKGLLVTVDRKIDKDSELHALVRWQFVGGLKEEERKAFLFTNIVDGKGRKYGMPVVVGALAANRAVYSVGMDAPVEKIQDKWDNAIAHPVPPVIVEKAACHDVVITGNDLVGEGKGLGLLPIPISTPGFDSAPTLTAANVVTKDPETGVANMGTYRCALKSPNRLVVRMATRVGGAGGYRHYVAHQKRGDKEMPCAIVLGAPPMVMFMGPQKLPLDADEVPVAGGLAGGPINMVKCKTVDLMVPAESEIVIEGMIDTQYVEPEAPFGESHGHVALEEYNMPMRVTAITHRKNAIVPSYLSQVAPSESSVIKRVAYEPLFLKHLRDELNIKGVKRVSLHEPLTGLAPAHHRHVRARDAGHGGVARALWRGVLQGRLRQDHCRGERGHRSRQHGRGVVGDRLPLQSDPRRKDAGAARPGPRPQARARNGTRQHDADRRDDEVGHAAARAAEAGVHGARQGHLGGARPACAEAAAAVVRLFARRLAAGVGRRRTARRQGRLDGERPHLRAAQEEGLEARDQVPAGRGGRGLTRRSTERQRRQ